MEIRKHPLEQIDEWGKRIGAAWMESLAEGIRRGLPSLAATMAEFEKAQRRMNERLFAAQRAEVEALLASPWWRHLRARWALRHHTKWTRVYPPVTR